MISPQLQLQILTGAYSSCNFFDVVNDEEFTGRTIMTNINSPYAEPDEAVDSPTTNDESLLCHSLGLLLHELFAVEDLTRMKPKAFQMNDSGYEGIPLAKKISLPSFSHLSGNDFSREMSISRSNSKICHGEGPGEVNLLCALNTIGYSTSLSQVVMNLVDCGLGLFRSGDSYPCLEMAIADLSLLLEEPGRFLFEDFHLSQKGERIISSGKGNNRLYGRTAEAHLITDTFCRVASTGESEAFLIGGFSGYAMLILLDFYFYLYALGFLTRALVFVVKMRKDSTRAKCI
jgi:hypothetical protein